jgi:GTP-binding protein
VGKSTLINAVLGSTLARVSNVPGRTQTLNWYILRDKLYVVDLPGYGFAQAPKEVQAVWRAFMGDYLRSQRKPLRRVFLLVDGRLGIQNIDLEMCELLHQNSVPHQIVCTKADKASAAELAKSAQTVKKYLDKASICFPKLIFTSCLRRRGIEELRSDILTACGIELPNQELREPPPELLAKARALESDPEAHIRHKSPKKKLQEATPLIDLPVTHRSGPRAPRRR